MSAQVLRGNFGRAGGRNRRRAVRFSAMCRVDYPRGGRTTFDFTRELSACGLFLKNGRGLQVGARVDCTIMLKRGDGPVPVTCIVRRTAPGGVGLEFLAEQVEALNRVRQFLDDEVVARLRPGVGGALCTPHLLVQLGTYYAENGDDAEALEVFSQAAGRGRVGLPAWELLAQMFLERAATAGPLGSPLLGRLEQIVADGLALGPSEILQEVGERLAQLKRSLADPGPAMSGNQGTAPKGPHGPMAVVPSDAPSGARPPGLQASEAEPGLDELEALGPPLVESEEALRVAREQLAAKTVELSKSTQALMGKEEELGHLQRQIEVERIAWAAEGDGTQIALAESRVFAERVSELETDLVEARGTVERTLGEHVAIKERRDALETDELILGERQSHFQQRQQTLAEELQQARRDALRLEEEKQSLDGQQSDLARSRDELVAAHDEARRLARQVASERSGLDGQRTALETREQALDSWQQSVAKEQKQAADDGLRAMALSHETEQAQHLVEQEKQEVARREAAVAARRGELADERVRLQAAQDAVTAEAAVLAEQRQDLREKARSLLNGQGQSPAEQGEKHASTSAEADDALRKERAVLAARALELDAREQQFVVAAEELQQRQRQIDESARMSDGAGEALCWKEAAVDQRLRELDERQIELQALSEGTERAREEVVAMQALVDVGSRKQTRGQDAADKRHLELDRIAREVSDAREGLVADRQSIAEQYAAINKQRLVQVARDAELDANRIALDKDAAALRLREKAPAQREERLLAIQEELDRRQGEFAGRERCLEQRDEALARREADAETRAAQTLAEREIARHHQEKARDTQERERVELDRIRRELQIAQEALSKDREAYGRDRDALFGQRSLAAQPTQLTPWPLAVASGEFEAPTRPMSPATIEGLIVAGGHRASRLHSGVLSLWPFSGSRHEVAVRTLMHVRRVSGEWGLTAARAIRERPVAAGSGAIAAVALVLLAVSFDSGPAEAGSGEHLGQAAPVVGELDRGPDALVGMERDAHAERPGTEQSRRQARRKGREMPMVSPHDIKRIRRAAKRRRISRRHKNQSRKGKGKGRGKGRGRRAKVPKDQADPGRSGSINALFDRYRAKR